MSVSNGFTRVGSTYHSQNLIASRVWCCNWRGDGKLLVTAGEDKTTKVWNYDSEDNNLQLQCNLSGDHLRTVRNAQFALCGRYLVTASFDSSMRIYEQDDGWKNFEEKHRLDGHEHEVKCAAFSASGQYLASASRDKNVFIWQFDEDEDLDVDAVLQNHTGDVKFVAWHPLEDILVSCGYDMSIVIYRHDGSDWTVQQTLSNAHEETIWSIAFSKDGNYFVSVGGDSKIKIWKLIRGNVPSEMKFIHVATVELPDCKWPIYSVSWDSQRNVFACVGGDRKLWVFEFNQDETATLLDTYKHDSDINYVAFHPKQSGLIAFVTDIGEVVLLQFQ